MRGPLPDLPSTHPLGPALPALYQDDHVAQRLLSALDGLLSPVFCTLDNLDAYFDPSLAPADFVEWLAEWVGLSLDENWPPDRRRALVAEAVRLYRWRGTARGLSAHVALYAGVEPEVEETGGVAWSPTPNAPVPGTGAHRVTVRLRTSKGTSVKRERIEAIVAAAKPAHVTHQVEVMET